MTKKQTNITKEEISASEDYQNLLKDLKNIMAKGKEEEQKAKDAFFGWVDEVREQTKNISSEEIEQVISEAVEAVKRVK